MKTQKRRTGWTDASACAGERSREQSWLVRVVAAGPWWSVALALLLCTAIVAPGDTIRAQEDARAPDRAMAAAYLTTVPNVTGLPLAQANERLRQANLFYQLSDEAVGQKYEDRIARQIPAANARAKPNTAVLLTREPAPVQTVPNMVIVPSIEKLTIPEARQKLQESGLRLAPFHAVSPDENAEIVTLQDPITGRQVPPGSRVTVRVEAQPQTLPTPTPVPAPAPYAAQPEQSSPAGVSYGHKNGNGNAVGDNKGIDDEVEVPDVVSDSLTTARRKLDQAGLRNTVTRDPAVQHFVDRISSQSPQPGEHVNRGMTVQLALQPGNDGSVWTKILIAVAVCIAVGGLVARVHKHRWPSPFIVHASLSFGQATHALRGDPPHLGCPPVKVRLTWSQQPAARVTRSPDSTRRRTH
ncbi:PASTA domain-containing protein [Burkholderia sp. D7]|nr:PASTA domain-containing protein [Burkholderia sp. D7]